jgi:hypothetical protein
MERLYTILEYSASVLIGEDVNGTRIKKAIRIVYPLHVAGMLASAGRFTLRSLPCLLALHASLSGFTAERVYTVLPVRRVLSAVYRQSVSSILLLPMLHSSQST